VIAEDEACGELVHSSGDALKLSLVV
jgi:hypothetical protein